MRVLTEPWQLREKVCVLWLFTLRSPGHPGQHPFPLTIPSQAPSRDFSSSLVYLLFFPLISLKKKKKIVLKNHKSNTIAPQAVIQYEDT